MTFTKSCLTIAVLAASLSGCGGAEFEGRIFGESLENGSGILPTPGSSEGENRINTSGFIIEAGSTTDLTTEATTDLTTDLTTLDVNMAVAPILTSVGIANNIGESGVVVVQFDSPVELDEDAISLAIKDDNAGEFVPVSFPVNLVQPIDGTSSVRSFVGSLAGITNNMAQFVQIIVDADRIKSTSGVLLDKSNSVPLVSELELSSNQPTVSISDTPVLIQPLNPSASSQYSLSTGELNSESVTGDEESSESNIQNTGTNFTNPSLGQLVNQDYNSEIVESADITEPKVELVNQSSSQVVPLDQEIQIKLSKTDGPELDDSSRAEEICSNVNLTNADTQQEIAAIPVSANTDEVVCGFELRSSGDDINFGPGQTFEVEVPENTLIDYSNKGNDELKATLIMAAEQVVTVAEGFVALSMSGLIKPLVNVQFNFDGEVYRQQLNEDELQAICGNIDISLCLKTLTASIIESYQTAKIEEVQNNTRVSPLTIVSRVVDGDIRMNADGSLLYNSIKESFISSSQSDSLVSTENEGDDDGDVQNTTNDLPEFIIVEGNTGAASEQSTDATTVGIGTETSSLVGPVIEPENESKNYDSRRLQRLTNQINQLREKREKNDELLAGLKTQLESNSSPKKSLIKQERKVERRVVSLETKIVNKQQKIEKIQRRQSDSLEASSDKILVEETTIATLSKAENLKRKQERRAQRQQARKDAAERRKANKLANKLEKQEQNRLKREDQQKAKAEKKQQRQARLEQERAKQRADKAEKAALRKQQRQARPDKQAVQRKANKETKEAKRRARLAEGAVNKAQRDAHKAAVKAVTPA